jgi:hypothetical protein
MFKKAIIGYTGSWAGGVVRQYKIWDLEEKLRKNPKNIKMKRALAKLKTEHVGRPVIFNSVKF